ncbi:MAG TPA: CHASE3 domain-containing protein, partial [Kofleriaceae bacterium]
MARSRAWLPAPAFAAVIAALAAVLSIGLLSYRALTARTEAGDLVSHTDEVQDHLHRFLSDLKDAETGQRGYLLTGIEHYLDPYHVALGGITTEIAALHRLLAGNPMQERRLDILAPLVTAKLAELGETIQRKRSGDTAGALSIVQSERGRATMDRIREAIETMLAAEQTLLIQRTDAWQATVTWASYVMFGGLAVIVAMIGLIGVLASRSFRAVQDDAWSRRVQLALARKLQGEQRLTAIGESALGVLVDQLDARVGAIYAREAGGELRRIAGHALPASACELVQPGDGLTGEAVRQDRPVHIRNVPAGYLEVSSTVGKSAPRELVITPAAVDGVVQAVTELGFLHALDRTELEAIDRVSRSIAVAVRRARDREQLEDVLEEVQRQTEELQAQQEELRVSNEELEHQASALRTSQVELEDKQAALARTNAQLEIQAQSLQQQRDELARTGAELQRSSDYKSQFLANMSHELRTPLNSTLILAKLLAENRDGNLSTEQVKFAQTIYAAGNDLLALINDVLDLSKIEAGMLEVRSAPVGVARLADELTRAFQPIAHHKQLAFDVRIAPGAPDSIDSDSTRLLQILRNLLSNAVKFTEVGGVSLAISGSGDTIAFVVRDTGIGIARDQHQAIFEPFRQVDGAGTRKFGGTGLGLSISRDLAHLLGGELQVVSAPGQGSTFTLTLPTRAQSAMAVPRRRSAVHASSQMP